MPGRSTAERSTWPQGCGKYNAAVKSGAVVLATLSGNCPLVSTVVEQVVAVASAAIVQLVVAVGIKPASFAATPPGVATIVSGCSADTENDEPHQAGMV